METSQKSHGSDQDMSSPGSYELVKASRPPASQVYKRATARIGELFARVEAERGVVVPEAVRVFLSSTAIESLHLCRDAWWHAFKADPGVDKDAERIAEQIHNSLLRILSNAEVERSTGNGVPRVTFQGLLCAIHDHWCKIFPFCGRRPSPPPRPSARGRSVQRHFLQGDNGGDAPPSAPARMFVGPFCFIYPLRHSCSRRT